jgi:protein tyrosine/serine phosphatase
VGDLIVFARRRNSSVQVWILAGLFLVSVWAHAAEIAIKGVPRFSQVNEHLYRGGQPSRAAIAALPKLGIHAVIDLRGTGERAANEEKQVVALGMKYYSVPLPPLAAPTAQQVATILALVEDSENWPVFIHCQRGKDRTGTIVACYRIVHDRWPNERALMEAKEHGLSRFERAMQAFIAAFRPAPVLSLSAGSTH